MNLFETIREMGVPGFLDIFIMAFLIYVLLIWFMRTRAAFVLTGIIIVAGIYLLTRQFNLVMTAAVFENFFAIILIALVVIFQEELRHIFERIAVFSFKSPLAQKKKELFSRREVEVLVRSLTDFARERIGALIVIRGRDMILRHLEGGIELNGQLSEPLLKSLFDPHSIGHDGAVVIEGNRVERFSCHLPLTKNLNKVAKGGTRHAAALGLAELSDALCLVVSEERGTISVARNGDMFQVKDPEQLARLLEDFFQEIHPRHQTKPWREIMKRNTKEKMIAFVLAVALWFVLVEGSEITHKTYLIPLQFEELEENLKIADKEPSSLKVTFRAPKRTFYFLRKENIKLQIPLESRKGIQKIWISNGDFDIPSSLELQTVVPREVTVHLERKPEIVSKKGEE